jgi:hypothetical protein
MPVTGDRCAAVNVSSLPDRFRTDLAGDPLALIFTALAPWPTSDSDHV